MKNNAVQCPALLISAPNSGAGKTTITAALASYHRQQGLDVRVFKVGPDFIDPMILTKASGNTVYQLDLWMVGKDSCQTLLFNAAKDADLILIESVMGLFDGTPSSAELAEYFSIPILAVIDASAMAQTFGALIHGLEHYNEALNFYGVVANKVASPRHADMLLSCVRNKNLLVSHVRRNPDLSIPERHLGIMQAGEIKHIDRQLELMAEVVAETELAILPPTTEFYPVTSEQVSTNHKALSGKTIAIIKDTAFNFLYAANQQLLEQAGANIIYCSALKSKTLPECDALYIPGGYPELHAKQLVENTTFIQSVQAFAQSGKPLLAECGGMLFLLESLTTNNGLRFELTGVLPGKAKMQDRLAAVGQQSADFTGLVDAPTLTSYQVRGHSFHYSSSEIMLSPITASQYHARPAKGEDIFWHNNVLASYMHWYFPSNPEFFYRFFNQTLKSKITND